MENIPLSPGLGWKSSAKGVNASLVDSCGNGADSRGFRTTIFWPDNRKEWNSPFHWMLSPSSLYLNFPFLKKSVLFQDTHSHFLLHINYYILMKVTADWKYIWNVLSCDSLFQTVVLNTPIFLFFVISIIIIIDFLLFGNLKDIVSLI